MKRFSSIVIFLTLAVCFVCTEQYRWKGLDGNSWTVTINSDGYGYYGYLPCIFIYHKFDYNRMVAEEQKIHPGAYAVATPTPEGKLVNKCFPGVAILLMPFFLIAYFLSHLLGYGTGGYEFLFQASVSIAALFYMGVGLIFLRKLLKLFDISEFVIGLTLIFVVFGTNLFYYATLEPSMSHVYSFGLTAFFLYYSKRAIDDFSWKNLLWMTISMSVLVLMRPTNLLSLGFIPFLAGSMEATSGFIRKFFKSKKTIALVLITFSLLFIQLLVWFLQTGHFFVASYAGETFNFKDPHISDMLFSFRKGWFIYTPLMFIALTGGLIVLFKQNRFRFIMAVVFSFYVVYVLSSWWSWWYGGGFGIRACIDFYPAFALMLAIFLNSLTRNWIKWPVLVLCALCVTLNVFQTYQCFLMIIPPDGMTKEKYWKIFMKKDLSYLCIFDYPDLGSYNFLPGYDYTNDFEHNTWAHDDNITTAYVHGGSHAAYINERNGYSPTLSLQASALPQNQPLVVYVKVWAYMPDFDNDAKIAISLQTKSGECYLWSVKLLQGFVFERNTWTEAYTVVGLPTFKNPTDELRVYVCTTKGIVYIDDMEVKFGTPR